MSYIEWVRTTVKWVEITAAKSPVKSFCLSDTNIFEKVSTIHKIQITGKCPKIITNKDWQRKLYSWVKNYIFITMNEYGNAWLYNKRAHQGKNIIKLRIQVIWFPSFIKISFFSFALNSIDATEPNFWNRPWSFHRCYISSIEFGT